MICVIAAHFIERNAMRKLLLFLMTPLAGCIVLGCSAPKPVEPASEITPIFTIREIMQSMVQPRADSLWNAVSVSVTDKGTETKAPKNDDDWANLRHEAVTVSEAMNLVLMPGRKVAKPGEQAKDPKVELTPEQIETLIDQDRASWTKMAKALQGPIMAAVQAIDAKNVDALSKAGGDIDTACETCHKRYWYPNEDKAEKK